MRFFHSPDLARCSFNCCGCRLLVLQPRRQPGVWFMGTRLLTRSGNEVSQALPGSKLRSQKPWPFNAETIPCGHECRLSFAAACEATIKQLTICHFPPQSRLRKSSFSSAKAAASASESNEPVSLILRAARMKPPQATRARAEPTEIRRTPSSAS
jgi:hypothetical protein